MLSKEELETLKIISLSAGVSVNCKILTELLAHIDEQDGKRKEQDALIEKMVGGMEEVIADEVLLTSEHNVGLSEPVMDKFNQLLLEIKSR